MCLSLYLHNIFSRVGHHSTSDDSTAYRPVEEIHKWMQEENPIQKFRLYLESKGIIFVLSFIFDFLLITDLMTYLHKYISKKYY